MAGVPISAMLAQSTLSNTDEFPFVVGSALGDNRKITWLDLKALIQTYGGVSQSIQTTNYANNNNTPDVIPSMGIVLTEGTYLITFDSCGRSAGTLCDFNYYLVYNTNSAITGYNVSDVLIQGSLRTQSFPASAVTVGFSATGILLTVPTNGSYIVKVTTYESTSQAYVVQNRVLTALKTL